MAEFIEDGVDTEDQVKKTIEMFPEALSAMSEPQGALPIMSVASVYWDEDEYDDKCWRISITNKNRLDRVYFMAVLAREGQIRNVGGHDAIGGLLLDAWPGCNIIQNLALKNRETDVKEHYDEFDMKLMNSLKRDAKKTSKQDIIRHLQSGLIHPHPVIYTCVAVDYC